jgi:hypothetical protein
VLGAEPEILDRPNPREPARAQLATAADRWNPEKCGMPRRRSMTPHVFPRFGLPGVLSPDVG